MGFDLDAYEPVAERLGRFLQDKPTARIRTELLTEPGADICVFKASIILDDVIIGTGHAEEVRGAGNVNRTSHVENCETSAIGRALANIGYAGSDHTKRPSREEMQKVQRVSGNTVITESGDLASDKQRNMIRAISKSLGKTPPTNLDGMTKRQASAYIDDLKKLEAGEVPAPYEPEEVF